MKSGIYKITNILNNKIYIGSAKNLKYRWSNHWYRLTKNNHYNIFLQRAWNKYGQRSFDFSVIERIKEDDLIIREQYWLDLFEAHNQLYGYNVCKIAGNSTGRKGTPESRIKQSISSKGKKRSAEFCEKVRFNMLGRKHSEESKKLMSLKSKGRTFSEETLRKIAISKANNRPPKIQKIKPVGVYKNGFFGRKHSLETIEKMRNAKKGKPSKLIGVKCSPETIEKMRIALTGKPSGKKGKKYPDYKLTEEGRKKKSELKSKKVVQYSLDGVPLKIWNNAKEAAEHFGCNPASISHVIKGDKKRCKGYKWKFIDGTKNVYNKNELELIPNLD